MSVTRALSLATLVLLATSCSRGDRVARLLAEAGRYAEAGELEKAEIEYKNVLQIQAENAEAFARLGLIYHEQGRDSRAAAFLLHAKTLQPDNIPVRLKLALAHLRAGDRRSAREEALFVLQHRPDDEQAPRLLVEASSTPQERVSAGQQLLALPPAIAESAPVLVALGTLALHDQRVDAAEALFRKALAADPDSAAAHGAFGMLHWSRGELASADAALKRAAELSAPRAVPRLHYIQFKRRIGEVTEAKTLLEEMTRQTPDFVPAWIRLTEIATEEKNFDTAATYIAQALALDPFHAEALLLSARLSLARGDTDRGVDELERMAQMFQQSPVIGHELGIAYAKQGEAAKAVAQLTQTTAEAPGFEAAALTLAEVHLGRRDFQAAANVLRPLLERSPRFTAARLLLAETQRGLGDFSAAAAIYAALEKDQPHTAQLAFAHGTALLQAQQPDEARLRLQRAGELDPTNAAAIELLVDLDLREKKVSDARARLNAALAKNPESVRLWALESRLCAAEGNPGGAEAALEKLLTLQPDSAGAHYELARLHVASGQNDKAIARLQEATRQNPELPGPWLILAVLLDGRKDHALAREAYEKTLALEPKNTLALNNLAYLNGQDEARVDAAIDLAQRARALLPGEPRTADTLGWLLTKKGRYTQAIPLLQESAARLPGEPEVHHHLGVARYLSGDEPGAKAAFEQALALNPLFSGSVDARQRLAVLAIDRGTSDATTRATLQKQLEVDPRDPAARLRLASLSRHAGDLEPERAHYEAILAENPRHAIAMIHLARLKAAQRDLPAALEMAKQARGLAPDELEVTHGVARIAYDSGDYRWAASLLQEAARAHPNNAELAFDWAEAAYAVGRVAEAEESMRRALAADPNFSRAAAARRFLLLTSLGTDPARAFAASAEVEAALQDNPVNPPALLARAVGAEAGAAPETAAKHYEALLAQFPDFSPAQRNLAMLYARHGLETDRAVAWANKARQAFPRDPELARTSGILAYRQSEFARALPLLQNAVAPDAQDAEGLYYLGMTQRHLNNRAAGDDALARALELGLQESLARQARESLAQAAAK